MPLVESFVNTTHISSAFRCVVSFTSSIVFIVLGFGFLFVILALSLLSFTENFQSKSAQVFSIHRIDVKECRCELVAQIKNILIKM